MNNEFPQTPQHYVDEFYAQLKLIDEFCTSHEIKYWIICGTLLGQVRNESFIPWDDDADVGIFEEDAPYIMKHLRPLLQRAGTHDLWNSVHGLKLFSKAMPHAGTDLFTYRRRPSDSNVLEFASDRSRKQWPNDYFLCEDVVEGQLERKRFGPLLLPVPRNPERYLKTLFGSNCLTHARLNGFDHMTGSARNAEIVDVPLDKVVLVQK